MFTDNSNNLPQGKKRGIIKIMKKRILLICLLTAIFLAVFEFYLFYLSPQELTFGSYFSSILQAWVGPKSDKLIRMNLYNKSITLFENGNLVKQTKIAAAGHPKATPTPQGDFKVLSKDKNHISGISGLVMPWSVRFYNGYYFHGLPYTRSGKIIDTQYSNGCVRLGPGLDEKVYHWAEIGTKVQIYKARLVKSAEQPAVYLLTEDGTKEWIPNPEIFNSRGFKWQDIATIPLVELAAYSEITQ